VIEKGMDRQDVALAVWATQVQDAAAKHIVAGDTLAGLMLRGRLLAMGGSMKKRDLLDMLHGMSPVLDASQKSVHMSWILLHDECGCEEAHEGKEGDGT